MESNRPNSAELKQDISTCLDILKSMGVILPEDIDISDVQQVCQSLKEMNVISKYEMQMLERYVG